MVGFGGRGLGGGIECGAECASRANIAPENRSSTRKPPPPHADPVLNTFLSMSQLHTHTHMHTHFTAILSAGALAPVSAGLRRSPRRRHLLSICSIAAFLASIRKLREYSHAALLARLCQAARRAARRLGVTDAALRGARLSFPPVRRLFILANHSVVTPGTEIVKDPRGAAADVNTRRHADRFCGDSSEFMMASAQGAPT